MSNRTRNRKIVRETILILAFTGLSLSAAGCTRSAITGEPRMADVSVTQKMQDDETAWMRASALTGRNEELSYALGMAVGKQIRVKSIEVDLDLYMQGLEDSLSGGDTLLTEEEARAVVQSELKKKTVKQDAAVTDIRVSFKLDPRLTKGLYMGDRWVSPPVYKSTRQAGTQATVEIRAKVLGSGGKPIRDMSPEWTPSDPDMVDVTPDWGNQVTITVKRPGQSSLRVASQEISKELFIRAVYEGEALQVEISQ